jgi:hypothetical protein
MARLARDPVPGPPHPATQQGARPDAVLFENGDRPFHLDMASPL